LVKIHAITGHGISSNIYVIVDEKIAIIDAGIHEISDETVEAISEISDRKPDYLILTHRHVDHIGGALRLKDEFSLKVFAGEKDLKAIEEGDEISTGAMEFGLKVFPLEVHPLREGDVINLGNYRLRVLETPGHTVGSISLYGDDGSLFSGDTLFADGGIGRWDLPTGDFRQLKTSIERLSKINVVSLYPGHGRYILGEGGAHVGMALKYILYY
jgi:hydroxyacylglutathione hydrolase